MDMPYSKEMLYYQLWKSGKIYLTAPAKQRMIRMK